MNDTKFDKIVEAIQKLGFPIVVALGLLWFSNNVYKDSLVREQRLVDRIDSFDKTLRDFGDTLKTIDTRLDKIETQSTQLIDAIPAATKGE